MLSATKTTLPNKVSNYYLFVCLYHCEISSPQLLTKSRNFFTTTIDKEPTFSGSIDSKLCLKCKKSLEIKRFFLYQLYRWPMAPQVGLEPTTLRLTAACSANWAIEEYDQICIVFLCTLHNLDFVPLTQFLGLHCWRLPCQLSYWGIYLCPITLAIGQVPATIYFPGQSPTKYHRREGA